MDTKIFQVAYVPANENYIDYGDVFRDENGKIHFASAHHGHIEKWAKQLTYIVDTSMRQDSIKKGDKAIMLKEDSVCYGDIIKCKSNKNLLREMGWCKVFAVGPYTSGGPFFPKNITFGLPKIHDVDIAYIAQRELTEVELEINKEDIKISSTGFVRLVRNIQIPQPEDNNRLLIAIEDSGTVMFALLNNNNFQAALKQALNEHYDCDVEIVFISEPDEMLVRTVKAKVMDVDNNNEEYIADVTLTPAHLYK
jgi:hypothetical protein